MKKIYYTLTDNADLSITAPTLQDCMDIIEATISDLSQKENEESEYTITPIYMTEEEFDNLPESEF